MFKTTCTKCNTPLEENRIGKQAYCLKCHAEYMRNTRTKHSGLPPEQRKKANARSYVNVYVNRGTIEKKGCCICGEPAEAHHNDYSKPLEVEWFCRKHHLGFHKAVEEIRRTVAEKHRNL